MVYNERFFTVYDAACKKRALNEYSNSEGRVRSEPSLFSWEYFKNNRYTLTGDFASPL